MRIIGALIRSMLLALLLSATASAATIPVTMNPATELEDGNTYVGSRTVAGSPLQSVVVDEYWFFSVTPGITAETLLTVSTVDIFDATRWNHLRVAWYEVDHVTSTYDALTPLADVNVSGALALALAGGGKDYALRFVGSVMEGVADATYSFSLQVTETPLPPALLLFGSALAGFGFLGRRRSARWRAAAGT